MPTITIRDLPPQTHAALKERAARTRRSLEAELRDILADAVFGARRLLTYDEWLRVASITPVVDGSVSVRESAHQAAGHE